MYLLLFSALAAAPPPPEESVPAVLRYLVPALESAALNFGIWGIAKVTAPPGGSDYDISFPAVLTYPARPWAWDNDEFDINQLLHPYHGALSYTAARSMGMGFWLASIYPTMTSLMWEEFMEKLPPSPNDQIMTMVGGIFAGEALYRLSELAVGADGLRAPWWRHVIATVFSPFSTVHRLALGDAYATDVDPDPLVFAQLSLGASIASMRQSTGYAMDAVRAHASLELEQWAARGFTFRRPFDSFWLRADFAYGGGTLIAKIGPVTSQWDVLLRGLLLAQTFDGGDKARGIGGLEVGWDYDEASVFRVSTLHVGPGLGGRVRLNAHAVLQGSALTSWTVFANASSTSAPTRPMSSAVYHLGPAGQIFTDVALILDNRVLLRATVREYLLAGAIGTPGWEQITRAIGTVTVRLAGPHALSASAEMGERRAWYPHEPDPFQQTAALRLGYSLVTDFDVWGR